MTPFAIAGLQLNIQADQHNLDYICGKIDLLMYLFPWVQMVVVSELATYGPLTTHAVVLPGPPETTYQEVATRHRIWLLPGSMFEQRDGVIYNTAPVINPDGVVIARHRKMFPFLPYESGVEGGTEFVVFNIPEVGRFGLSICYDMWFPETSRTLALMGAEVILHPTLTGTVDREVECTIARATAACNQCFVVDINGCHDGGNGRSSFVGPLGDLLYEAGAGEEMIPIEIDLDRVRRTREVGLRGLGQPLKSFRDRKVDFDIYKRSPESHAYLNTLGPLVKATRGSRAGIKLSEQGMVAPAPIAAPLPPTTPASAGGLAQGST